MDQREEMKGKSGMKVEQHWNERNRMFEEDLS
jgi:hypothetical protein